MIPIEYNNHQFIYLKGDWIKWL